MTSTSPTTSVRYFPEIATSGSVGKHERSSSIDIDLDFADRLDSGPRAVSRTNPRVGRAPRYSGSTDVGQSDTGPERRGGRGVGRGRPSKRIRCRVGPAHAERAGGEIKIPDPR